MPDLAQYCAAIGDEWSEIGELFDLLHRRPAWQADAACREAPASVSWFPAKGGDRAAARAICARCLVLDECRSWALDQGPELAGIWAGMSPGDRAVARRGMAA